MKVFIPPGDHLPPPPPAPRPAMPAWKSPLNPMFRNQFSEDIFLQKYRHPGCETWYDLARTLVKDVCNADDGTPLIPPDDQRELVDAIAELRFIPGGRYLYYAGRPQKFFNNCLSAETEFVTRQGLKTLGEMAGKAVEVLSPATGNFLPAEVRSFGVQPLYEIVFANVKGKSKKTWTVEATADHRWYLKDGSVTTTLKVGDVIPAARGPAMDDEDGWVHGAVFGDGNVHYLKAGFSHQLRLCGKKAEWLDRFEGNHTITYPPSAGGDPVVYVKSDTNLKLLPGPDVSPAYKASFLRGWMAMDGHYGQVNQIHSTDLEAIEWFRDNCVLAGWVVTGDIVANDDPSNFGPRNTLYRVSFKHAEEFAGFKVVSIRPTREAEVFCVVEPKYSQFTLAHGLVTGNCYLLKSEEDTREDWAQLSWKAESCLMTGGGIGNDYSVYRAEGQLLHGTGGTASGPVPKALMVNEIGRRVMQGGSRRSAIYASLNWAHPDVGKFLTAKDWKHMPIAGARREDGSPFTVWDAKQADFNYPAPLDMTNISVNYDTAWLQRFWVTGDPGELFTANCRQALSTAEPGFSFNFFDKEGETLRNACTEVTSSDDSDVCNLGSVNLSRIESIQQLRDTVRLGTMFLLCGTLRAKLPYEKIARVREKNRRLGLGLMGIHEWLLQRNMPYEVTPELHRWLAVYRGESDRAAIELADKLGLSRPVARRAIAPTGTIGILAGTTTGIEPLFAVAYKRRFLKGTTWHYQFVIDGAAQEVIDRYGTDPERIDSALSMAGSVERRIRFQADVQDYVDMAISSTVNLPAWGTPANNEDHVKPFALTLAKYAHRLRGFTCYPDGSRGGQPLTVVPYKDAVSKLGETFREKVEVNDVCTITGRGGSCGV